MDLSTPFHDTSLSEEVSYFKGTWGTNRKDIYETCHVYRGLAVMPVNGVKFLMTF